MALHAPTDASNYANFMIKSLRLSDVVPEILDEAAARIWYAAPWSWTIVELAAVTVVAGQVDYTVTTTGADYLYKATLVSTADGADAIFKNVKCESFLPAAPVRVGEVLAAAIVPGGGTVRLYPKPPASMTTQKVMLYGKIPYTKIDSGNKDTAGATGIPDRWWHVYKSFVLSLAYQYADDDRGYNIKYDTNSRQGQAAGQLAISEMLLDEMRHHEPMPFEWETYAEAAGDKR